MPHPVARLRHVGVGRVFDPRLAAPLHVGTQRRPGAAEERPDHRAAHRQDAAQPARTGAAQQPQQHGFRLVVGGVRDGHDGRAAGDPRAFEERVAGAPRRHLD